MNSDSGFRLPRDDVREHLVEVADILAKMLDTTVKIPNANKAAFDEAVEKAKAGCPISKLLNAKITLSANLA